MSRALSAALALLAMVAGGGLAVGQSFYQQWGSEGEPGSYRVWFDPRGATVWRIWLLDHFQNVAARNQQEHDLGDHYLLVRNTEPEIDPRTGEGVARQPFLALEPDRRTQGLQFPVPIDGGENADGDPQAWEVERLADGAVHFTLDGGEGLVLEKEFRPRPGLRIFDLIVRLRATADLPADTPQTMFAYLIGPTLSNPAGENLMGFNSAVGIVQVLESGEPGAVRKVAPENAPGWMPVPGGGRANPIHFAGTTNRFFGNFFFPLDDATADAMLGVDVESLPMTRNEADDIDAFSVPRMRYRLRLAVPRSRGQTTTLSLGSYLGPKSFRVFGERAEYQRFAAVMDEDLTPPCFCTIPGARFMAGVLLKLLGLFQGVVVNWGAAIIMLTLLVRGLLVPLNFRMQKSMRAFGAKMARLKPEMDEIKKRYEKDPKAYQRAMMEFNRKHKVVPPIGGCLPIFLTMPVWIGLFTALRVAYDLRQEPFLLWIDDLSRPDALIENGLSWMPFYFEHFNLLPLIMMTLWYWAQSSTPLPADPQQRQMMKIMRFMPFFIGIMLYNYAAGLMLYMITSSAWALVEMRITRKLLGPMPTAGGIAPMTPM